MANADFSHSTNQTNPGGFDSGSYREQAQPEQAAQLTHGAQLTRICRHFDKFGAQLQQNTLGFLQRRQIARRQQRLPRQRNRQIFTGMTRRARLVTRLRQGCGGLLCALGVMLAW